MPTILEVTLNEKTNPWTVDVNQSNGANHVQIGPNAQTITWQLVKNAAGGSFVALTEKEPGFAWIDPQPPQGIFKDPAIGKGGKELTISDTNNSEKSKGEWTYVLRVNVGGTVYSTIYRAPIATNSNPTIRNN